jgi:hypothetical protein
METILLESVKIKINLKQIEFNALTLFTHYSFTTGY